MNRKAVLKKLRKKDKEWDIVVIGGGSTGLGCAVDAASRGYKTLLLEQIDFSKGTSSRSTKLVHGGVRYLQQGDISMVFEALQERGLMFKNAPHLVSNQSFIIPTYDFWGGPFYTVGLKVYDMMAGKLGLGPSKHLSLEETTEAIPTVEQEGLRGGVIYQDGQFDDSRMAVSLAQTCVDYGGTVLNYCKVTAMVKNGGLITGVEATDTETGENFSIKTKVVINATGVFADEVIQMDEPGKRNMITPSQGIHLVLEKDFLPNKPPAAGPAGQRLRAARQPVPREAPEPRHRVPGGALERQRRGGHEHGPHLGGGEGHEPRGPGREDPADPRPQVRRVPRTAHGREDRDRGGRHARQDDDDEHGLARAERGRARPDVRHRRGVPGSRGGSRSGSGNYFVAEACEYDRSFLNLRPKISVVTNIEEDHLDYFSSLKEIQGAFADFVSLLPEGGYLVVNRDDPNSNYLSEFCRSAVGTFSLRPRGADWWAEDIRAEDGGTRFLLAGASGESATVHLRVPGGHNVSNALAATAVCRQVGVPLETIARALGTFTGARRRFDILRRGPVMVIDDYAHHPTEMLAVLRAARQSLPGRRLIAVFQPHQHSRLRKFRAGFAEALARFDLALITDVYAARDSEEDIQSIQSDSLVQSVRLVRPDAGVVYTPTFESVLAALRRHVREGDAAIFMGAGSVTDLARRFAEELADGGT